MIARYRRLFEPSVAESAFPLVSPHECLSLIGYSASADTSLTIQMSWQRHRFELWFPTMVSNYGFQLWFYTNNAHQIAALRSVKFVLK